MLRVNSDRLRKSLEEMGQIGYGGPGKGVSRLALSDEDKRARDLFVSWLKEAGLEVIVDPIGDIFGLREGSIDAPPVMAGSHLDTVREGGAFDGALGVLGALEAIRTLNDYGIRTRKPVAVACFTDEEGARFQPCMLGSGVVAGLMTLQEAYAKKDDAGISVEAELERIGYKGNKWLKPVAYFELHVEQGPVLDAKGISIGVVEGIQGIAWWQGKYQGEANHAGTTPLDMRRDALLGAAELVCSVRRLAEEMGHDTRTTVGRLHPHPDIINVVPGQASFTIDLRQYDEALYEDGKKRAEALVAQAASNHRLEYELEMVGDAKPVHFDPAMVNLVEEMAREAAFSYMRLPSGAGHDAQYMHSICPTAMIFVPSIGGRSHCPQELTDFDDAAKGATVLANAMLRLAGS